jgi:hypothetical protein
MIKFDSGYLNESVELFTEDGTNYVRYSPDSWYRYYGESLESDYGDEAELELAYQQALKDGVIEQ